MHPQPKVRCYQYVNRPYDRVRATLHNKAASVLQSATRAASSRTDDLASTLRVTLQGIEVGVDVHIEVGAVNDEMAVPLKSPATRVKLSWKATRAASLFPQMVATLSAWPLSPEETQIEIEGDYTPPLGAVGRALDAAVLHRVAEAAVHRFLEDVVEQLRRDVNPV